MRSEVVLCATVVVLSASVSAFAETRVYLQEWHPRGEQHIVTPQNLTGAPDGRFGGTADTTASQLQFADYYQAFYDLGRTVTTDRVEVVYKGLGAIRIKVGMSLDELSVKPYYWSSGTDLDATPGQGANTVRTVISRHRSGFQRFRYVGVYLVDPGAPNAGAGVWIDAIAALISLPQNVTGAPLTGTFTTIDYPGAKSTVLTGIDHFGQIAGCASDSSGQLPRVSSFLWRRGVFEDFPAYRGAVQTCFQGLNNNDMMVGQSDQGSFLYRYGSRSYSPISYSGPGATWARGVNALGEITGSYVPNWGRWPEYFGFILFGDTFKTLQCPGALQTDANGITGGYDGSPTRVVGSYLSYYSPVPPETAWTPRGFLWSVSGFMPVDFPDARVTTPNGIYAQVGDGSVRIVGSYVDALGKTHGFLLENGQFGTFRAIDVPGAKFTNANAINSFGHIVGTYGDATGTHGFRLVP